MQRLPTHCSESFLDLVPLSKNASGPLQYEYHLEQSSRLPGAHGDEVVRDLFTDVHVSTSPDMTRNVLTQHQTQTTYTCGEDGHVRAWKMSTVQSMDVDDEAELAKKKDRKEKRKEKKGRKADDEKKVRYKPY
jgi:hypothetical protein